MPFPSAVNVVQAPAVVGDFASTNPRSSVDAGPGALVAGPNGVTVGRFAWADANNITVSNTGTLAPTGILARDQQAIITAYLGESTMVVPTGLPVTLYFAGDFWVKNDGTTAATIGQKAYANNVTGQVSFAATGNPTVGATATSATLAKVVSAATGGALPTTNTATGSIAGTVLTVTAVGTGSVLGAGLSVAGTGVDTATVIVNQLTGTAGSTGTYTVNVSQTVASTALTIGGGGLTLTGANTSGVFAPGMVISGTNIPTGTTILGYGTATAGGAGTYYTDRPASTAATASTITATNAMYLTVDASSSGVWAINDLLTGSSVVAQSISATGATNANLTGVGGSGTYLTNGYQTALTAQTISVNSTTETPFRASSAGAVGELVKISN
jgi:hypothetical protein